MKTKFTKTKLYKILAYLTIIILAIGFTFPLYWIITGSFKTPQAINATTPQWFPQEWTLANYEKLFSRQVAPLWEIHVPFTLYLQDLKFRLQSAGWEILSLWQ